MITLTTDFGLSDPYVAQMKGVIFSINPGAEVVDITHDIAPQDVKGASFVLGISFSYFPAGTVHVAVVDPGVGSNRRGIIVSTARHFFVGPDNGIFSFVIEQAKGIYQAIQITNVPSLSYPPSQTFHGRDVFAPVAARLTMGADLKEFGPEIEDITILPSPRPMMKNNIFVGEIVYLDRFGNAVTNFSKNDLPPGRKIDYLVFNGKIVRPARFYTETSESLACLFNSMGFLELFTPLGSAKETHKIKTGMEVQIVFSQL